MGPPFLLFDRLGAALLYQEEDVLGAADHRQDKHHQRGALDQVHGQVQGSADLSVCNRSGEKLPSGDTEEAVKHDRENILKKMKIKQDTGREKEIEIAV